MKIYQLEQLEWDCNLKPKDWYNGMVLNNHEYDTTPIAVYYDLEEALEVLKGHPCYVDKPHRSCVEYHVSTWEGNPDDEPVEREHLGDDYVGEYPYIKVFDEDGYFVQLFDNLEDAKWYSQDNDWLIGKGFDEGKHTFHFINMNSEEVGKQDVEVMP